MGEQQHMLHNQYSSPRLNVLREPAFLLIVLLSTLTSFFYLPYVTYGPSLIQDNFTASGAGWSNPDGNQGQPGQGPVSINNKGSDTSASLSQVVYPPAGAEHVLLSARARSQNVVPGVYPWNLARLILLPYPRNSVEPDHRGTQTLFKLTGTTNWAEYSQFFPVPDDIAYWKLQAQLSHAVGAFDLDAITLHAAMYKRSWLPMQLVMISLGLTFLALVFAPYYRHRQGHHEIAGLLCIALIAGSTTIPATLKADMYQLLVNAIALVPSAMASNIGQDASNILADDTLLFFAGMHFSLFAITAWLLLTGMPVRTTSGKLYDMLTLAVVTECLQVFVTDRSPSVLDVTIDMGGAICGLTAYYLWQTATTRMDSH
jgi:VanZ family protein